MSTTDTSAGTGTEVPESTMDLRLEVVLLGVSDTDRAKAFYESLGWRLDAEVANEDGYGLIQMTPPGSKCSLIFGSGVSSAAPGRAIASSR